MLLAALTLYVKSFFVGHVYKRKVNHNIKNDIRLIKIRIVEHSEKLKTRFSYLNFTNPTDSVQAYHQI